MVNRSNFIVAILGCTLLLVVVGLQVLEAGAGASSEVGAGLTVARLEPVKDNTLYGEYVLNSNGKGRDIFAGATQSEELRRAVMKFDIAGNIPSKALILSVTLRLSATMDPPNLEPQPFSIHRVTADWGEGASNAAFPDPGGSGTAAEEGDATWSLAFYSPTPTERISWTNPGGDFLPAASANTLVGPMGQHYFWGPSPAMIADLRHWQDFPDDNFGWLLKGNESKAWTARRFGARENDSLVSRPALFVEYLIVQGRRYLPLIVGN